MADEMALIPKTYEWSGTAEIGKVGKDKLYTYQMFSIEGFTLKCHLVSKMGLYTSVELPVTSCDVTEPWTTEGDKTVMLTVTDNRYGISITIPHTVHVYERWATEIHGISTSKEYKYGDEFNREDIIITGTPNIQDTPLIQITDFTCDVEDGTLLLGTEIEVTITCNVTRRDDNFNPSSATYSKHVVIPVTKRLDGIWVSKIYCEPYKAIDWDKCGLHNVYNDGKVIEDSYYGQWDYYSPTDPVSADDVYYMDGAYGYVPIECRWGDLVFTDKSGFLSVNRYRFISNISGDEINSYDASGRAFVYHQPTMCEIDAPWVTDTNDISYADNFPLRTVKFDNVDMLYAKFSNCARLTDVSLANCRRIWGNDTFSGCTGLSNFYAPNCLHIGVSVFKDINENRLELSMPQCQIIDSSAFENSKVLLNNFLNLTNIGNYAFRNADVESLIDRRYQTSNTFNKLYTIGDEAFKGANLGISSHAFGNLSLVPVSAFEGCISRGWLKFPVATRVMDYAFKDFSGTVFVPSVRTVGKDSFRNSTVIVNDDNLKHMTSVGGQAFRDCTFMGEGSINLDGLETIPSYVFEDIQSGNATPMLINMPNTTAVEDNAFYHNTYPSFPFAVSMPNVETIGWYAFYKCGIRGELDMPKCTYIGAYAFMNNTEITKVVLNSCETIEGDAFNGCRNLEEVIILTPSCGLYNDAFRYTFKNVTYLCNPNLKVWVRSRYKDDYKNSVNWNHIQEHIYGIGEGVVTLDDDNITRISEYEWSYLNSLKHVSLDNCTEIEAYGFYHDLYMETINLPSVVNIGERAFSCDFTDYPSLHWTGSIILPNCEAIGESAFGAFLPSYDGISSYESKYLESLYAPKLKSIGNYGMIGCRFSGTVSLPKVESIGNWAFYGSYIYGELNLPNVKTLGREAFRYCDGLTSISIPNCTSIGRSCFNEQNRVTYLDCHNVEELGDYCLAGMTRLHEITLDKPMCTCGQGCLNNVASDFKVYVNDEDYDWYVSNWRSEYVGYITKKSERVTE